MTVHFTLQGKGGFGKSMIAGFIAQYYIDKGQPPLGIDTDPVNATLKSMKALAARDIQLLDGNRIDTSAFDDVVEMILNYAGPVVVDNGASSFIPLSNYLAENPAVKVLQDAGRTVIVHSIITGGPSYLETVDGFYQVVEAMPAGVKIVVWINDFFGPVLSADGKPFEDLPIYEKTRDRIAAILRLRQKTAETFGQDIRTMLEKRQTFAEAIADKDTRLMAKQRLKSTQDEIYQQLALIA